MTVSFDTTYLQYVVYAVLVIATVFFVRFLIKRIISFFSRPELHGMSRDRIKQEWEKIEDLLGRKEDTAWKLAVMEADKLLDHSLKSMAIPGINLGERLKFIQHKYPKINQVWGAHKIRNRMAHESGFRLSNSMAKRAIKDFKNALEELNVL
ncbi:MAG: hypothetical protein U9P90_00715 [Patescibacteria group bacterium]|nr:hypothetical protein [Patescibacteria group bacterium]